MRPQGLLTSCIPQEGRGNVPFTKAMSITGEEALTSYRTLTVVVLGREQDRQ